MNSNEIAVLGDPQLGAQILAELKELGLGAIDHGELELQDEFQVRRWMAEKQPKFVFVCVSGLASASTGTFSFTVKGSMNVIASAVGYAQRLIVVSVSQSPEFFIMRRFCYLYHHEKGLEFQDAVRERETTQEFAKRCVLFMRDGILPPPQADTKSASRTLQGREVRKQVLSQPQGDQQHGSRAEKMLEVPQSAAQGAPSDHLRSQSNKGEC